MLDYIKKFIEPLKEGKTMVLMDNDTIIPHKFNPDSGYVGMIYIVNSVIVDIKIMPIELITEDYFGILQRDEVQVRNLAEGEEAIEKSLDELLDLSKLHSMSAIVNKLMKEMEKNADIV